MLWISILLTDISTFHAAVKTETTVILKPIQKKTPKPKRKLQQSTISPSPVDSDQPLLYALKVSLANRLGNISNAAQGSQPYGKGSAGAEEPQEESQPWCVSSSRSHHISMPQLLHQQTRCLKNLPDERQCISCRQWNSNLLTLGTPSNDTVSIRSGYKQAEPTCVYLLHSFA